MASNRVEIWNLALSAIGEAPVQSEDDVTSSASAESCSRHYLPCLKSVLERLPWPFAVNHCDLTPAFSEYDSTVTYAANAQVRYDGIVYHSVAGSNVDHTPDPTIATYWSEDYPVGLGWGYVYLPPADCVRPLALYLEGERWGTITARHPFKQLRHPGGEGVIIACDIEPDDLGAFEYVSLVDYPSIYPQLFVDAFVALLASKLALALAKDEEKATRLYQMYLVLLSDAADASMNSQQRDPAPMPSSIRARD
jgi:hypothetical protein